MLLEPYEIDNFILKNRIVHSATYEKRATSDGFVTKELVSFYNECAEGGCGLIITGNASVHPSGRVINRMIHIHQDAYIPGLKSITKAVHVNGCPILIQLNHGGRQCFPRYIDYRDPIAPSPIKDRLTKIQPREITEEEIFEIIEAFGDAARRAMEAGFDGIQIQAGHGYLVHQFLSPNTNRREDRWGGDSDRRFRFLEQIFRNIKTKTDDSYPIFVKLNGSDSIENGSEANAGLKVAEKLQRLGATAVEVSGGTYESIIRASMTGINCPDDEAYFRSISAQFKKYLDIPVILVGGIRSRKVAEELLANNDADLISLSRPLIREPDLPIKFAAGKDKSDCISCNGCMKFFKLDSVKCTQGNDSQKRFSGRSDSQTAIN